MSNRLPKYRKHSTGLAFVEVCGKRHYLGQFGSSESRQRYAQIVAEIEEQRADAVPKFTPANVPRDLLISELVVAYTEFARTYYVKDDQPTSQLVCIKCAMRPLIELFGEAEAAQFTPFKIKVVRERMIEEGLARKTINARVQEIRRLFRWAGEEEMLPPTVWHGLQQVRSLTRGRTKAKETQPVGPVADEVVDATLPYLPPVIRDMVQFQRLTGARPGEVCKLRPGDIDRTYSEDVWAYRPASHKTEHHGRDRVVFIGPRGQCVLAKYLFRGPGPLLFFAGGERTDASCQSPPSAREQTNAEPIATQRAGRTCKASNSGGRAKLLQALRIQPGNSPGGRSSKYRTG